MLITCVYSMMIVVIMKFKKMGKLSDNFIIFEKNVRCKIKLQKVVNT